MNSRMQIKVLGRLSVLRDGAEVVLPPSRKTRALLAYLAVSNRPHTRAHLCQMFWEIPDDPRASLRWSLTKLRSALRRDGDQVGLNADDTSVVLDSAQFEVDSLRIGRVTERNVSSLDTSTLESLASEFRGPFLEDLELPRCPRFEAWRAFTADALERARAIILRALIERLRREPERALLYAEALQAMDPADQETCEAVKSLAGLARRTAIRFEPTRGRSARETGSASVQEIRYCRSSDGTRIAYAVSGKGAPLVRSAHWMSHLQFEWESPVWRHWIDALSKDHLLVRYDQRGNGLSDWDAEDLSLEAMVSDLESVADATGLTSFPLLGVSQSCSVSVAFAVRHPERVSRLVLYGGYAQGWRKRPNPHEIETHEAMTTLIREGWGNDNPAFRQLFTEMFIPGASRAQMAWFNDLQKATASPGNAALLHNAFGDMDVSAILTDVKAPTLVLHARNDAAVPFEQGKALAAGIPGARFVDLDSANHILLGSEPAFEEFLREVRSFLASPDPL
jgi:pimeloyl-ACP methyl ester carboxylesterase/DNA-binding SARP family transcriptional activator